MAGLNGRSSTALLGAAGIALILLVTSSWLVGDDNSSQFEALYRPTAFVQEGPFSAHITEEATLEARQSVILASDLPSNSAKVVFLAPEGEMLNPGDVVARFDPTQFNEQILQIENDIKDEKANLLEVEAERLLQKLSEKEESAKLRQQVEFARLRLQGLREGDMSIRLARAQRDVDHSRNEYEQAKKQRETEEQLLDKGLTRAKTHQQAVEDEEERLSALRIARQNFRALQEVTIPSELRQADIQYEDRQRSYASFNEALQHKQQIHDASISRSRTQIGALQQKLAREQLNLERTTISAPLRGMLLYKRLSLQRETRKVQVGDSLWHRQGFAVIPDMSAMVAVLQVRESELGKLTKGQLARVDPQAFPELRLAGHVESIGTLASDSGKDAGRYFNVRLSLQDTDPRLRPGMTARTAIQTSKLALAIQVPIEAVFYEGAQAVCFLWRDGKAKRVSIELGVSDGKQVVVISGLNADDEVMLVYPRSVDA